VQDLLADKLLAGEVGEDGVLSVDAGKQGITITPQKAQLH
jgi:hypothetical protein